MAFDPQQLDEIRARVPVSEVVGARFPLLKRGAEYVVKGNESFTVNDKKGFWCEFGSGGDAKPHDIFDFLQLHEGFTFVGAVEELAKKAGITLKQRPGTSGPHARSEAAFGMHPAGRGGPDDPPEGGAQPDEGRLEVVATWDYKDPEANLLYQVVRRQRRLADGSWKVTREGKPWKTFAQRRPSPDGDGSWVWGLEFVNPETKEPHEFMRFAGGDWMRATDERKAKWKNCETRYFETAGNVEHWLYNANAVIDELQEPPDEQRPIFLPEGEGKVDAVRDWGLLAVTNSGGSKHFTTEHAEFFRNAAHLVLLVDNDRAGVERVAKIAPMLRAVDVQQVSVLNFKDVWPACPLKGDVTDWRDKGGGTRDALLEIVDGLKPWAPEPYKSKFGAKTARDLYAPVRAYPWRIKGLVPLVDNMLVMGPSKSGKTFEALDMVMHVHNGESFAGRKVIPGGFVYLTYEGATGFENRLRAYMQHHRMTQDDLHSFAWLTRPPGIFASEDNVTALAQEVVEVAKGFRLPLAATVVDTHNSATRGSSEIKSDDLNIIMHRYAVIAERTGAPLWIIGHTNAEGKHRGNEQFFNNIETALLVQRVTEGREHVEKRDDNGRVVRRVSVNKQREGDDRTSWDFVLEPVTIGIDEDGDNIPSMVSVEPARAVPDEVRESRKDRPEGYYLNAGETAIFKALLRAIEERGIKPPPELQLPATVPKVISSLELGKEYRKGVPRNEDESPQKYTNRTKAALNRFKTNMMNVNVVIVRETKSPSGEATHWMWPAGRRVYGKGLQWPALPPQRKKAAASDAQLDIGSLRPLGPGDRDDQVF